MAAAREDRFANIAATELTMSALNTLSFAEMLTGISLGQGVGMLIDEIDYQPGGSMLAEMSAVDDSITMALTTSNDIIDLDNFADRRIIHSRFHRRADFGTAGSAQLMTYPIVSQFFPPMIIASPRVYLACDSAGLASAGFLQVRLYFRYIQLTPQQYIELAEAFVLVG